jgi:hypothetical protein
MGDDTKKIRIEYQKERVIVKAFASQALILIRDVDISSKPSRVNPTTWMVYEKERKGHFGYGTGVSRANSSAQQSRRSSTGYDGERGLLALASNCQDGVAVGHQQTPTTHPRRHACGGSR